MQNNDKDKLALELIEKANLLLQVANNTNSKSMQISLRKEASELEELASSILENNNEYIEEKK